MKKKIYPTGEGHKEVPLTTFTLHINHLLSAATGFLNGVFTPKVLFFSHSTLFVPYNAIKPPQERAALLFSIVIGDSRYFAFTVAEHPSFLQAEIGL